MSKFSEFYMKVLNDDEAKKELSEILAGKSFEEASKEQLLEIGKLAEHMGYSITIEEAVDYLNSEEMELDEKDLDSVAGGKTDKYIDIYVCEIGGQAGVDDKNFGPGSKKVSHT